MPFMAVKSFWRSLKLMNSFPDSGRNHSETLLDGLKKVFQLKGGTGTNAASSLDTILNGQFRLQNILEMAELPRETVLILDNSGKNWTHDGGCTFGPTVRWLMTHVWMQSSKFRVNTITTQNMFAHTSKKSFPLLHQGAASTTELSKPVAVSGQ